MEKQTKRVFNVGTRSFITALIILFLLMMLTYALTLFLPAGEYQRVITDGKETIVPGTYQNVAGGLPFWRWLLSPFLALGSAGSGTVIAIIAFLLVIGGAFHALDEAGVLSYMFNRVYRAFETRKYRLLLLVSLFFMGLGAFVGSFEECVPLVPIAVALAYSLGWDALVGLGMSLLAVGFGFSTGVVNPFTVGVAQQLVGLPMFSGIWMRLVTFVLIYGLLIAFLVPYAKKIERNPAKSMIYDPAMADRWAALRTDYVEDKRKDRALIWFAIVLGTGILMILLSSFVPFLQDIIMPLIAVIFLVAGTVSSLVSGMRLKAYLKSFGKGMLDILPAVLLILMANSIRYTMTESKILDTILYQTVQLTQNATSGVVVLMIYALALVLELFISSGSAKAFLLMPLIAPIADLSGISRQIAVLAYAFGDGFSNVFYPTNPVLLISLGIVGIGYGKWFKWSAKIQGAVLVLTCALLLFANSIGY
ncbi:MAG TPA: AbgT family transporter [Clostridia bacterium]|nr:AbgT family transporter [Clostridia bacterium]